MKLTIDGYSNTRNITAYIITESGDKLRVPLIPGDPITVDIPADYVGEVFINDGSQIKSFPANPHPWKTNLRDVSRMLVGEIGIPHPPQVLEDSRSANVYNRILKNNTHLECMICNEAIELRNRYQQLLSKEL